jgi:uracil-DNA glycosylase
MSIASPQVDLFAPEPTQAVAVPRLTAWAPEAWPVAPDWASVVAPFWRSAAGQRLADFIGARLAAGAVIYPPRPLLALELTPLAQVRVVILGQDPYHGPGQAEGLAFSVAPGIKLPPSLRNIFKEQARDPLLPGPSASLPANGSLRRWAQQGVLLLNACLTVEEGCPGSHAGQGWEALTDMVFKAVLDQSGPVVFMLWGAHAQRMADVVRSHDAEAQMAGDGGRHLILCANHPSPLSALRPPQPFIGCGHFGQANAFLQRQGGSPVDW